MSNPFPSKFDGYCGSCGDDMPTGRPTYAIDGQFVCEDCARENGNVCGCGNFKKDGFPECFTCARK